MNEYSISKDKLRELYADMAISVGFSGNADEFTHANVIQEMRMILIQEAVQSTLTMIEEISEEFKNKDGFDENLCGHKAMGAFLRKQMEGH